MSYCIARAQFPPNMILAGIAGPVRLQLSLFLRNVPNSRVIFFQVPWVPVCFLFCFVFHKKIKFMCLCMDSEQSCDRSFAAKTKKKNRLAPSLSVKPKIGPYDTCKYQKYISISFMDSYFDSSLYLCDISYKIALK